MKKLSFLFLALIFTSCSVPYNNLELNLNQSGKGKSVALAVIDNRPYVVSGQRRPSYVGARKREYGTPFHTYTTSGNALAFDLSVSISENLSNVGYVVDTLGEITFSQPFNINEIANKIHSSSNKFLVFQIDELKINTYVNGWLNYDITLYVLDENKKLLAKESISGSDRVEGSYWSPSKVLSKSIPQKTSQVISELLNRPSVVSSLR